MWFEENSMAVPRSGLSAFHQMTMLSSMPDHMVPPLLTLPGPQTHLVHDLVLTQRASFQCCVDSSLFSVWCLGTVADDQEAMCFEMTPAFLQHLNASAAAICLYKGPRDKQILSPPEVLQQKEKISLIWDSTVLFVNTMCSSDNTEMCRKSCFRIHRSEQNFIPSKCSSL